MRTPYVERASEECRRRDAALARAFDVLGKRWSALLLGTLGDGSAGFRELSRAVGGISDSVLACRLAELAAAGLLQRTVVPGPPVSVSYALSDCARALVPALREISAWAQEHFVAGAP